MRPATIVNEMLAKLFRNERNPIEPLADDQSLASSVWVTGVQKTADALLKHGRLVQLECRHFVLTKALHRAACPRCGEMIQSGWDYDAFRNMGAEDTFSWEDDPFAVLHEKNHQHVPTE